MPGTGVKEISELLTCRYWASGRVASARAHLSSPPTFYGTPESQRYAPRGILGKPLSGEGSDIYEPARSRQRPRTKASVHPLDSHFDLFHRGR